MKIKKSRNDNINTLYCDINYNSIYIDNRWKSLFYF